MIFIMHLMNNLFKKTFFLTLSLLFSIGLFSQAENADTCTDSGIIQLDYPASFQKLLNQFENKVVFIDFMGSWCADCVTELKEFDKLNTFFEENNIIKLFIAVDNPAQMNKCIELVKAHNAIGYLVPFYNTENKESTFKTELDNLFFKDGEMHIIKLPRYVIIDRQGNVAEMNAQRPSRTEELKTQLKKYL